MVVTRRNGVPGLPASNNFKVMYAGAKKLGYKQVHTGHMAINSRRADGRGFCIQQGFCVQGCKMGAKWSTLYTEIPRAEATGNLDLRIEAGDADRAWTRRPRQRRGLSRSAGQRAATKGAPRLRRGQRHRNGAPAPAIGVREISARPRKFFGSGRPELSVITSPASSGAFLTSRCIPGAERRLPGLSRTKPSTIRGAVSPAATESSWSALDLPTFRWSACRYGWGRDSPP